MEGRKISVLSIVQGGLIAALYIALTGFFQPIVFGPVQIRISEALCACALYSFAAVPGMTVGCLVANLLWSPFGLIDALVGTVATLIGTYLTYVLRRQSKLVSLLPPVLSNALLVPIVLMIGAETAYPLGFVYVLAGQAIACYGLGTFVAGAMERIPFMKGNEK